MRLTWVVLGAMLTGCPGPRPPGVDGGGSPDSGSSDSGLADAGVADAGLPDAGSAVDAGPICDGGVDISSSLLMIAADNALPALGAAASSGSCTLAIGVTGVRKLGDPTPVTVHDAWHLGSDTKAMTATLTAEFVEEGTIRWDTTLPQAFPTWTIDPGYQSVTIQMLLAHVGGAPPQIPADVWAAMWGAGSSQTLRTQAVQTMLSRPPGADAGTFAYANAGYMMVGSALEQATGIAWEQLITQRIFNPLGMSCGFGPMANPGQVDGIWGTQPFPDGGLTPVDFDNPPALGPAGTVHCPLEDWLRFAREHVRGGRGEATILGLSPASWNTLHTPWPVNGLACDPTTEYCYALGWVVTSRSWAGGTVLTHLGTNTVNYADIWLAPLIDRVYVSTTNRGDLATCINCPAYTGCDTAVGSMVGVY